MESKKEEEKEENGAQQSPQKSGGASVASLLVGINAWTSVTRTIVSRQDNTHSLSRNVTMAEISREKPEGERIEMEIDKDELERERETGERRGCCLARSCWAKRRERKGIFPGVRRR